MAWYHEVRAALVAVFQRRHQEEELAEELSFHLDMEADHIKTQDRADHQGDVDSAREASRRARKAFGNVERYKDDVRDERGSTAWDQLRRDVALSARSLLRQRGFTALSLLTLAVGIGAATTLFSVSNAVLLNPLPYAQSERVAVVWSAWEGFDQTWLSWDEYEAWKAGVRSFEDVGLFGDGTITISGSDASERVRFAQIGAPVIPILGVKPLLGRNFTEEEDSPNSARVIILSHALWQRRYEADPQIIGREIQVDGAGATVIGVMPQGFKLPLDFGSDGPTLAWMPLATNAEDQGATPGPAFSPGGRGNHNFYAVARLTDNATSTSANRELASLVAALVRDGVLPAERRFRAYAVAVDDQIMGTVRPVLFIALGAAALLLLIACANVAALLLLRSDQRRRELAVRVALGAGDARVARFVLTETVLIAALGGAAGTAIAFLGAAAARRFAPASFPRMAETYVDGRVVACALALTLLAVLVAGIVPALSAARIPPAAALKDGGRNASVGGARTLWRRALVVGEIVFAVVIVVGAGLMIRSVRGLSAVDRGFDGSGVLSMQISTPATWYPEAGQVAAFWRDLTERVSTVPGVQSVGSARLLPLASEMGDWGLQVEGYTPPPNQGTPGDWQVVTPGYFETMGLRLISGRFLAAGDDMAGPLALVVNREFVSAYLEGRAALGTSVRIGGRAEGPAYTIVGVVDDVRQNGLIREVKPQFYATLAQFAIAPANVRRSMYLVVRGGGDPRAFISPVRQIVQQIDPRLPISEIRTVGEVFDAAITAELFAMRLLTLFGALALGLSALGVYGVVSQAVVQRKQEFAIRAALGATPRTLLRLSLSVGMKQALAGLAVGLVTAAIAARSLGVLLYGVNAWDPITFAGAAAVATAVTLAASSLPAWRAAQRSPVESLLED